MQHHILDWLIRVTWQTALLALAVLAIQWALGPKLPARWRYNLWLLLLLRFVLPVSVQSSWSIFNFAGPIANRAWALLPDPHFGRASDLQARNVLSAPAQHAQTLTTVSRSESSTAPASLVEPKGRYWNRSAILFAIWIGGGSTFLILLLLNAWKISRKVTRATLVADPALLELLDACRRELKVATRIALLRTDAVPVPAIYGWREPRLLLPAQDALNREELRFVFLHELAHVKRGDIPMNWLIGVLQAAHWFNPFAWLVFRRMRSDCELACDALVLAKTGHTSRQSYGETILRLIERMSSRVAAPGLLGISHDKSNLRERMERIARFTSPGTARLWPVLLGLMLAAAVLTDAVTRTAEAARRPNSRVQAEEDAPANSNFKWSPLASASMLKGRAGNSAIWTGRELIVYGGEGMGTSFADGARYSLANDEWSPLSEDGAPSSRTCHTAVWTGKEMIVWGGFGGIWGADTNRSDGAIYDPRKNSWRSMTEEGAPVARFNHTTVWTGKEMLVWGGYTDSHSWYHGGYNDAHLNSGGGYDPVSDSWRDISRKSAPSKRFNHIAVWTGDRMIVWGGGNSTKCLNDGGVYDPASDKWTPINTRHAPRARSFPIAVWTGKYLIVWGGCTRDGKVIEDGGRYDPDQDTWTQISTDGAPIGRIFAQGIWTGKRMVFWGGVNDDRAQGVNDQHRYVATGAAYDPTTDSWSSFEASGGPSGRLTNPVWTGEGLLVFGGYGGTHMNDAYFCKVAGSH